MAKVNNGSKIMIDCYVQLTLDSAQIKVSDLIDKVRNMEMPYIDYGDSVKMSYTHMNGVLSNRELHTVNNFVDEIDKSGIYFIFSYEKDKLLYVGKSKNIRSRLSNHLIKCNAQTYSHIEDVHAYLLTRKGENKPLKICYCTIGVSDPKKNSTVEGAIIDYVLNSDLPLFDSCWNIRED